MYFRGYEVSERDNCVIIEDIKDFDPVHTFECGQCFRWVRETDGSHTGVVKGRVANIRFRGGRMEIRNSTLKDFDEVWFDYLDLGRDYSEIKRKIKKDGIMEKAVEFGSGIRLLRQDPWETLVSFIISANNRIPMIMKVISAIARMYGKELIYGGRSYYTFPAAGQLAEAEPEEFGKCRGGYRCNYILSTSAIASKGGFDPDALEQMNTDDARSLLVKLPGVGWKVADCTLLFGGIKHDVFPTDVWVRRVMEELYFKRRATFSEIRRFSQDYFGEYAGFAQQYLFFYAREHRIGAKR